MANYLLANSKNLIWFYIQSLPGKIIFYKLYELILIDSQSLPGNFSFSKHWEIILTSQPIPSWKNYLCRKKLILIWQPVPSWQKYLLSKLSRTYFVFPASPFLAKVSFSKFWELILFQQPFSPNSENLFCFNSQSLLTKLFFS